MFTMHHLGSYNLVSLLFGTKSTIPTYIWSSIPALQNGIGFARAWTTWHKPLCSWDWNVRSHQLYYSNQLWIISHTNHSIILFHVNCTVTIPISISSFKETMSHTKFKPVHSTVSPISCLVSKEHIPTQLTKRWENIQSSYIYYTGAIASLIYKLASLTLFQLLQGRDMGRGFF